MPADVLETVRRIRAVHVVVPARNEAQTLPATLTALERARERLLALRPEIRVDVTVALDRCEDNSAGIVRAHRRVGWIQLGAGDVGRARAVGVAWARAGSPVEPGAAWIANTDADSQVPPDWLTAHVAHLAGFVCWKCCPLKSPSSFAPAPVRLHRCSVHGFRLSAQHMHCGKV